MVINLYLREQEFIFKLLQKIIHDNFPEKLNGKYNKFSKAKKDRSENKCVYMNSLTALWDLK